ncbi:MAG: hypothetical protein V1720_14760 [bacterium]
MKILLKLLSYIGLGLNIIPAFFVFNNSISWNTHSTLMAVGTVLWFSTAPLWIKKDT